MKGRIVGDGDGVLRSEDAVVFDGHDHGLHHVNGLPDPIVIAVNIYAEQADIAAETCRFKERIDVIAVNELGDGSQVVTPVIGLAFDHLDVRRIAVNDQAAPVIV